MNVVLDDLYQLLNQVCTEMHICASVWGSIQRNELTQSSDIDIICYTNNKSEYNTLRYSMEKRLSELTHDSIPWDIAFIHGSPYDYALVNGTNYHSVFFSDLVVGDKELSSYFIAERDRLRNNTILSVREFFNLFTSYWGLARVLNKKDDRYAKFSMNGTNKWVRLIQAAQLRWHFLIGKTSKDVIIYLCQKFQLEVNPFLRAYESDFEYRVESEYFKEIKDNTGAFENWHLLFQFLINDCISWIQADCGVPPSLFHEFCQTMNIIGLKISNPMCINKLAESVITAFVVKDSQKIESILLNNINDWWAMTNLCVNENVSQDHLEQIVFPNFEVDPILWKSVRLYVAKNKNTSPNTLIKILKTKGLRKQDYLAAQNNLDSMHYND